MDRYYERLDENYETVRLPRDDKDGSITGKIVLNVPAYFDENPDEQKRLGWIKHIIWDEKEIEQRWPHSPQSEFLVRITKQVDEWTVEDDYRVLTKSEDQLLFEEMLSVAQTGLSGLNLFI